MTESNAQADFALLIFVRVFFSKICLIYRSEFEDDHDEHGPNVMGDKLVKIMCFCDTVCGVRACKIHSNFHFFYEY